MFRQLAELDRSSRIPDGEAPPPYIEPVPSEDASSQQMQPMVYDMPRRSASSIYLFFIFNTVDLLCLSVHFLDVDECPGHELLICRNEHNHF